MTVITEFDATDWSQIFSEEQQQKAVSALENGKVVFFPQLSYEFNDEERQFLSGDFVCPKSKNVSFDAHTQTVQGIKQSANNLFELKTMMRRFSDATKNFLDRLMPAYEANRDIARTSYRPVQVQGRPSSYRKDDARLHVDAFPSTPMAGKRILRVFSNVNHLQHPRVWRIGESFEQVAEKFLPGIRKLWPFEAELLKLIRATRNKRTAYDHYMLNIHHKMKKDEAYQKNAQQVEFHFPPGSTWMVFTDQVSHAAMKGQFLLEQSFYLPVSAMVNPENAPLSVLERMVGGELV